MCDYTSPGALDYLFRKINNRIAGNWANVSLKLWPQPPTNRQLTRDDNYEFEHLKIECFIDEHYSVNIWCSIKWLCSHFLMLHVGCSSPHIPRLSHLVFNALMFKNTAGWGVFEMRGHWQSCAWRMSLYILSSFYIHLMEKQKHSLYATRLCGRIYNLTEFVPFSIA